MYVQRLATFAFIVIFLFSILTVAHEAWAQAGSGVIKSPQTSESPQPGSAPSEGEIAVKKTIKAGLAPFEGSIKSEAEPPSSEPFKGKIEVEAVGQSNAEPCKTTIMINPKAN